MFRAMGVAFALAMTPVGASAQQAADRQLPAGWEFIEVMDWVWVGGDAGGTSLMFIRRARQPDHIWIRYELKSPTPAGARSWNHLVQVDCSGGRTKVVSGSSFSENNLLDFRLDSAPEDWRYPSPGTRGDFPLQLLCD